MVQDTGNRLIAAFQKQTEKISYFCSAENVSPNLAVHEFRKSFKRMRSLLHFYSTQPIDFFIDSDHKIKKLNCYLWPIRESYVNLQLFDRLLEGNALIAERKLKVARELLLVKNKDLIENQFQLENGCEEIIAFTQFIDSNIHKFGVDRPTILQLKELVGVSFQQSYDKYNELTQEFDSTVMHVLRRKMKRLWYQLDFLKFMHPRYFRMKSDQLNKITEHLGEDHDLNIFMTELIREAYNFNDEEQSIILNLVEHQRELNNNKLMPWLKQFFNEPPSVFDQKLKKIFKIS